MLAGPGDQEVAHAALHGKVAEHATELKRQARHCWHRVNLFAS